MTARRRACWAARGSLAHIASANRYGRRYRALGRGSAVGSRAKPRERAARRTARCRPGLAGAEDAIRLLAGPIRRGPRPDDEQQRSNDHAKKEGGAGAGDDSADFGSRQADACLQAPWLVHRMSVCPLSRTTVDPVSPGMSKASDAQRATATSLGVRTRRSGARSATARRSCRTPRTSARCRRFSVSTVPRATQFIRIPSLPSGVAARLPVHLIRPSPPSSRVRRTRRTH